ncbi:carbohydrate ABC transporter permease [Gemmiger formicilis]|uniref:carbohydrate ABC transporter permease n=1 Tax=Gemmiger formicilis TaxID=745368 RepID=UPI001958CBA2|nr:carbohydrate ABC transporter permease [Gemmiger formicilis]MBM6715839.1 carbohydrate ABC transporter permease [Gemmiger formicilis]
MKTKKLKHITAFDVIVTIIAIILIAVVGYPLILVLSNSVSDPEMVATGQVLLFPKGFTLEGYKAVFTDNSIMTGYANTIFYTVCKTLLSLVVMLPAGYALTRTNLPGRKVITVIFMITMYFSGGLIPTFLQVKAYGLYNTRAAIVILGCFSMYNVIICRSFFSSMPHELVEAAEIDGCSPMKAFVRIILPLSKALIGVIVLYVAVGQWNSYMDCLIYIQDTAKMSLQVILRRIMTLAQTAALMDEAGDYAAAMADREALLRYAAMVVSSVPLLVVYPFLQKYFDKGIMIGSVKG